MNLFDFSIARLPRIIFAPGAINQLPEICLGYGNRVLLVTGAASFINSEHFKTLTAGFSSLNISFEQCAIPGEPSPQLIDALVNQYKDDRFDVVLGIGGGSALDAAKAIAGLLNIQDSVMDYLEGVGPEKTYTGPSVPFIAVPTTAGTGSEATKNAVLSLQGENGFKKSFRDDKLVAEYALVDPALLATCPKNIIAANGMDAFTQLIESYVSLNSNHMTDALALQGIRTARDSLLALYHNVNDAQAQSDMAYASLMSGICLAQTGLGSVHGLASPLGAFYPIPHGVVCGTLLAEATQMNIQLMTEKEPTNPALQKYAEIGEVISGKHFNSTEQSLKSLCTILHGWTETLNLPRLGRFGLTREAIEKVVLNSRGSSMKTNPIVMTDKEIAKLLLARL